MTKSDHVRALSAQEMGSPYIFGADGCPCTPAYRRTYAGYNPGYRDDIYSHCPVLSGKQGSCAGCRYQGRRAYDCRGFTRWLMAQAGLSLFGGGATTQYETDSNWVVKGPIDKMPNLTCCVFKKRDAKMSHTGMHIAEELIRHCSGEVKEDHLPGRPAWTHFGIPAGLYTNQELEAAGVTFDPQKNIPTYRKGSAGGTVKQIQTILNASGAGLTVDGIFGAKTESALKTWQAAHGLTADGIAGPKTQAAMCIDQGSDAPEKAPESAQEQPQSGDEASSIWCYLMGKINNACGVAGIMGNLAAESGLNPKNLQGSGNTALGMTDQEYTRAVDTGEYSEEKFIHDGYGYGLAQWTHPTRKRALLEATVNRGFSVGCVTAQLDFLVEEMQKNFLGVYIAVTCAKTVREASDAVLLKYERPANVSPENQEKRAARSQEYFERFADGADIPAGSSQDADCSADFAPLTARQLLEMKACLSDMLSIINQALEGEKQ